MGSHPLNDAKAQAKELWSLGAAMDTTGQRERALDYFDKALSFDTQDPRIWQSKGFALQMLKRHEEAICSYMRALEVGQTRQWDGTVTTLCNMGEAYEALGRYDEAISCYNRCVNINPSLANSLRSQILRGQRLGNYRGTIRIGGKVVR